LDKKIREDERAAQRARQAEVHRLTTVLEEARRRSRDFADSGEYRKAEKQWIALLHETEDAEEKAYLREIRMMMREGLESVQRQWREAGGRAWHKARLTTHRLSSKKHYSEAVQTLDAFLEDWKDAPEIGSALGDARGLRSILLRKQAEKIRKDREEEIRKLRRRPETGKMIEALVDWDHFKAEWRVQDGRTEFDVLTKTLLLHTEASGRPARLQTAFHGQEKWLDYEVSFEYKSDVPLTFLYRWDVEKRKLIRGALEPAGQWTPTSWIIAGGAVKVRVGAGSDEAVIDYHPGAFGFWLGSPGEARIRNLRFTITGLGED
jgi:hypothetical protein